MYPGLAKEMCVDSRMRKELKYTGHYVYSKHLPCAYTCIYKHINTYIYIYIYKYIFIFMNMQENTRQLQKFMLLISLPTSAINTPKRKKLHEQQLSACHNVCTLYKNTVSLSPLMVNNIYVIYTIFRRD
jgi:hypothetical protein